MDGTRKTRTAKTILTAATGVLLMLPTGCGYNLMHVRRDVTFRTESGQEWQTKAWLRPQWGAMDLGGNFNVGSGEGACVILGVMALIELTDDLGSCGWAIGAMFDDDLEVAYGPVGWILSILPLITLIPPDVPREGVSFKVSDEHLAILRDGTPENREQVLARIRDRYRYELIRLERDESRHGASTATDRGDRPVPPESSPGAKPAERWLSSPR